MTTTILTLHDTNRLSHNILRDTCRAEFLDGQSECSAFALALHEGLGWPMIGLMNGNLNVIRHVAVQCPDGTLYDARGKIMCDELGFPFDYVPPYVLQEVTAEDLLRLGEPDEVRRANIEYARRIAEALWPELPWKNSLVSRVSAFTDELEALSRKYGLWVRANSILSDGDGDETGYKLTPTMAGLAYTIEHYSS